jgi:hypothetical protein
MQSLPTGGRLFLIRRRYKNWHLHVQASLKIVVTKICPAIHLRRSRVQQHPIHAFMPTRRLARVRENPQFNRFSVWFTHRPDGYGQIGYKTTVKSMGCISRIVCSYQSMNWSGAPLKAVGWSGPDKFAKWTYHLAIGCGKPKSVEVHVSLCNFLKN